MTIGLLAALGFDQAQTDSGSRWDLPALTNEPAAYQPAWDEFQANQAKTDQRLKRDLDAAAHDERGRRIVASGETAGYPAALVERARSALTAADQATALLAQLGAAADQYIARHGLVPPASSTYKTLHIAEAVTAVNDTAAAARQACARLGLVAQQVEQARAVLASDPDHRRAIEQQYQAQLSERDQVVATAQATLRALGV